MIRNGELQASQRIDEAALTEMLGISRTPLREALKVLVAEGLLRIEPRHGCFVNELSTRDLNEIFPLIAMLEGRCAYEAARKASDADIRRLAPLHRRLRELSERGDTDQYYETNAKIHKAIQTLADNHWLSGLADNLRQVISLSRHRSLSYPGRLADSCAEHLAIFAAIKAHDAERAESVARDHLLHQLAVLNAMARLTHGEQSTADAAAVKAPAARRRTRSG
ncbi:MAG: GntR family transcriptional regulator [Candidimonas sp.]|nr:MAG: GntR family transcriptional regulator [Candidimonas sp.]